MASQPDVDGAPAATAVAAPVNDKPAEQARPQRKPRARTVAPGGQQSNPPRDTKRKRGQASERGGDQVRTHGIERGAAQGADVWHTCSPAQGPEPLLPPDTQSRKGKKGGPAAADQYKDKFNQDSLYLYVSGAHTLEVRTGAIGVHAGSARTSHAELLTLTCAGTAPRQDARGARQRQADGVAPRPKTAARAARAAARRRG